MADGQLSVTLAADIQNFIKGLQDAAKQSTETGNSYNAAVSQIVAGTARINATNLAPVTRTLEQVEAGLVEVGRTSQATSTTVTRSLAQTAAASASSGRAITVGSNQAANALTNVGRVAQDLPFGFVGIQNNLNPLLESFQRLKAETGSASSALKALGQSLAGPAGLGVALSIVGAGILLYQQYQQKAAKASIDGAKSNEEYAKSLNNISSAAAENLSKLSILYEASQDANRPLADRQRLVDALQKQYPAYFGNLKDEAILAGKAAGAYENLQQQLINTAIVKASEGVLSTKFKALADLSLSLAESEKKLRQAGVTDAQAQSAASRSVIVDETGDVKAVRDYKNKISDEIKDAQKVFAGLTAGFSVDSLLGSFTTGIDKDGKTKKIKSISDVLKELNVDLIQADTQFGKNFDEKSTLKISAYQKAIDELIKLGYKPASDAIENLIDAQQRLFQLPQNKSLSGSVNQGTISPLNTTGGKGSAGIKVEDKSLAAYKSAIAEAAKANKKISDLINNANQILTNGLSSGLSTFADSIGSALASGSSVIDAVGQGLLSGLGDILKQLGEAAIKIGVGLVAIKLALKSLNPVVAIAAGVGLVALGSFFTKKASSIGNNVNGGSSGNGITAFANGGVVYGPTNALIGEYAGAKSDPEVVAPLSKLKSIIGKGTGDNPRIDTNVNLDGQFVLTGQNLALAIKRYNNSNR